MKTLLTTVFTLREAQDMEEIQELQECNAEAREHCMGSYSCHSLPRTAQLPSRHRDQLMRTCLAL